MASIPEAAALLDSRLAKSSLFTDGSVKVIPATSNVGPLGLFAFALTTALLQGQFTTVADGDTGVNGLVLGYGMFYGGLAQLIAGILEYGRKNTFGTVAFTSYGAFWMALAFFSTLKTVVNGITPQLKSGASGEYKVPMATPISGERMMLILWGLLTLMLWLCTFSMTLATSTLFLSLALLFFFLAAGQPQSTHRNWMKFAGAWGWWTAGVAFYDGLAALMKEVYGKEFLPVYHFKPINSVSVGHFGTFHRASVDSDVQNPENGKH